MVTSTSSFNFENDAVFVELGAGPGGAVAQGDSMPSPEMDRHGGTVVDRQGAVEAPLVSTLLT
jgi:hypothetical protein